MNNVPYYSPEDVKELDRQQEVLVKFMDSMKTEMSVQDRTSMIQIFRLLPMHLSKALVQTLDKCRNKVEDIELDNLAARSRLNDLDIEL